VTLALTPVLTLMPVPKMPARMLVLMPPLVLMPLPRMPLPLLKMLVKTLMLPTLSARTTSPMTALL
jgi:hypothetical protein